MLIRVAGSPDSVTAAVRDWLKRAESEIELESVAPLKVSEEARTPLPRFTRSLLLIFAALAVVLAGIGMYGVASSHSGGGKSACGWLLAHRQAKWRGW